MRNQTSHKTFVWLQGGLGNQLFQLNAAINVARIRQSQIVVMGTSYCQREKRSLAVGPMLSAQRMASIVENVLYGRPFRKNGTLKSKVGPNGLAIEVSLDQNQAHGSSLLVGYFQDAPSLALGTAVTCQLLGQVRLSQNAQSLARSIEGSPVVHVRRGDYVNLASSIETFGLLDTNYYLKGIEALGHKASDCFFFTDDPEYVLLNFGVDRSKVIGPKELDSPLETLLVMASSRKLVIPNSTFSWWAAEIASLGNAQIVGPKVWFKDREPADSLVRSHWIKIDN